MINAENADLFFVVARNNMNSEVGMFIENSFNTYTFQGDRFCYVIEKAASNDRIVVSKPKATQGLNGTNCEHSYITFYSINLFQFATWNSNLLLLVRNKCLVNRQLPQTL